MSDGMFKRGAVWWTRLQGKRVSTGCKDREAARAWRAEREREIADPAYAAAHTTTVDGVIGDWLDEVRAQTKKKRAAGTIDMHETKAGHIARVFAAHDPPVVFIGDVTAQVVDEYIATRIDEGAARPTIKKELGTLGMVLVWAKRRKVFPFDIDEVMPESFDARYVPRKRWLTPEELDKLIAAFEPHPSIGMMEPRRDMQAWILWTVATGGRWSESVRAQRCDVDLAAGTVRVRGTKTEESERVIPIVRSVAPLLERALELAPGHGEGELFAWEATDRPRVWRSLAAACKRAGIDRVSANDLRRTLASWLVQGGAIPAHVGKLLGHTTGRMVERVYGQLPASQLGKLIEDCVGSVPAQPKPLIRTGSTEPRNIEKMWLARRSQKAHPGLWLRLSPVRTRSVTPKKQAYRQVARALGRVTVSDLYREIALPGVTAWPAASSGELFDGTLSIGEVAS